MNSNEIVIIIIIKREEREKSINQSKIVGSQNILSSFKVRNDAFPNLLFFLNGERLFQGKGEERKESFGDEIWEKKKRDGEKNGHELQSMAESFNLNEQNHFHSHFSSNHNRSTRRDKGMNFGADFFFELNSFFKEQWNQANN